MTSPSPETIHVVEIEAAINYWRARSPSPDGITLAAPLRALAEVYALMAIGRATVAETKGIPPKAMAAIEVYRAQSTPQP
ncbi:DUF3717 domain-containing protein [Acidovorax sp. sic0104]|uniref:DUF3717 domain-containing protein n=1 Tax=Acidovorax sp. sic0104 TaxID=2854784 RepID=UPI001C442407|nr:DUF3717 domain-containing protein [Acidovorax sp. sic0104]